CPPWQGHAVGGRAVERLQGGMNHAPPERTPQPAHAPPERHAATVPPRRSRAPAWRTGPYRGSAAAQRLYVTGIAVRSAGERRGARNQHSGAGGNRPLRGFPVDSAVDLEVDGPPRRVDHAA